MKCFTKQPYISELSKIFRLLNIKQAMNRRVYNDYICFQKLVYRFYTISQERCNVVLNSINSWKIFKIVFIYYTIYYLYFLCETFIIVFIMKK